MLSMSTVHFQLNRINDNLRELVRTSSDGSVQSGLALLMCYVPQTDRQEMENEIQRVFAEPFRDDAEPVLECCKAVMSEVDQTLVQSGKLEKGDLDVPLMLRFVNKSCQRVFKLQFNKLYSEDSFGMSDTMSEHLDDTLKKVVGIIEDEVPFKEGGEYVTSLDRHLELCRDRILGLRLEPVVTWNDLKPALQNILHPWMFFKYVASFVPGDWNASGNGFVPSYEDIQFAELALYRMTFDTLVKLRKFSRQLSDMNQYTERLEKYAFLVTESITRRYIEPKRAKYPEMYEAVVSKSQDTKENSQMLHKVNEQLEQRKSNLQIHLNNFQEVQRELRHRKLLYWLSVAVYAGVVWTNMALIYLEVYEPMYLMSGFAVVALILWGAFLLLRNTFQRKMNV